MARINRASGLDNPLQNVFPTPIVSTRNPGTSDKNYPLGMAWVNTSAGTVYHLVGVSSGSATWALSSPGDSDVDALAGDSGTDPVVPTGGKITLTGGTNIATVGGTNELTINLDAAITLATSVTSPLYTASAADVAITAPASQDIVLKMGNNDGTSKVSFLDSDDAEVFSVDDAGSIGTLAGLTITGAFTTAGGAASINASSNFNTVINSGTSTGTVTIGNSAAGAITVDTAAGLSLDAATASNFTVTGAADLTLASTAGSIPITAGEAAADAIVLNASNGAGGVQLQAGTGGVLIGNQADCTTIDVGDFAPTASRTITVGGGTVVTASVTDTIDIAPDGATTNADSVKTVNVNTGGVTTGQVLTNIASGTITSGTHTVSIQTGNAAAGTVATNLSTGTGTKTVNVGNADAGTTMNVDAVFLVNDSVNANTSINTGSSTGTVSVGNAAAGAITVDTAAGISLDAATASNFTVTGAADLTLTSTAGSIPITAGEADAAAIALQAAAGGLDIDTGLAIIADAAGNIELNSSAGTILIGNDDVDQNASFATDGERTVTVGSTNGAAALVLQAGTGNITATGTFESITSKQVINSGATITFKASPTTCTAANTAGVATGATGDVNLLGFEQGIIMEQFIIGAGQTIIKPTMANSGLLCSLDLVTTEGVEYNFGAGRTTSPFAFTIGADAAFFFEVTMTIADISGGNPYFIGFRKSAANNATYTSYTDYYALGMNDTTSSTNVTLASELNAGGTTLQDSGTAWTGGDGGTTTLKVLVSAAGVVTATIDGGGPSTPLAYTFDDSDVVCPFIHIVHNGDAGAIHLVDMSVGYQ